jgi:hypothetical protein
MGINGSQEEGRLKQYPVDNFLTSTDPQNESKKEKEM